MKMLRGAGKGGAGLLRFIAQSDTEIEFLSPERIERLGTLRGDVNADLPQAADGVGVDGFRVRSGAGDFDVATRPMAQKTLRHLRPAGITRTQKQHPHRWSPPGNLLCDSSTLFLSPQRAGQALCRRGGEGRRGGPPGVTISRKKMI